MCPKRSCPTNLKRQTTMLDQYVAQVRLLLSTLPDIARETVFGLKGGTAINLFYRDMPRL